MKGRPADHPVIVHLARAAQLDEWAVAVSPTGARRSRTRAGPARSRWSCGAAPRVSRRGDRRARHRRAAGARPAGRARAARRVRRWDRRAVGEPVRAGEPDDRGATCAPTSATTSTSCSTAARARSASSRRSSTAPAPSPAILRVGGVTRGADRGAARARDPAVGGATARAGHARVALRAERAGRGRRRPDTLAARAAELVARGRAGRRARTRPATSRLEPRTAVVPLAAPADVDAYAHELYAALREADDLGLDVVLAVAPPPTGLGAAVADRLRRAAAAD